MKGIVFSVFSKMVEEKFGLKTWDDILLTVNPKSGGSYTSAATYDDSELFSLVQALSKSKNISVHDLVFSYGEYLLLQLALKYPVFFQNIDTKQFLMSIDQVIHVGVKKLYPDAGLPSFTYENPSENKLVMNYQSPRKLCRLAEGLISGVSIHFRTPIHVHHPQCLLRGDDGCRLELTIGN